MTLRTIESEFTEQLQKQLEDKYPLDLTIDGPIMDHLHPKLIWTKLLLDRNPSQIPERIQIPGWHFECFENRTEAEKNYPGVKLKFTGKPWSLNQFFLDNHSEAIIEFPPLGAVLLSRNSLRDTKTSSIHHHLIPIWLNYVLSHELWGPQGKWPKFHQELGQLFREFKLLKGREHLGYYELDEAAQSLASMGFNGTSLEKNYILVLPWTFSLSSLEKLKRTVRQEF